MDAGSIVAIVLVLLMICVPAWFVSRNFDNMSPKDQKDFLQKMSEDIAFSSTLL